MSYEFSKKDQHLQSTASEDDDGESSDKEDTLNSHEKLMNGVVDFGEMEENPDDLSINESDLKLIMNQKKAISVKEVSSKSQE